MASVGRAVVGDLLQNKLLDEVTGTVQDFINHWWDFLPKLSPPAQQRGKEPRVFKHYLSLDQQNITAVLLFFK